MADISKIQALNGTTYDINVRDTLKLRYPAGIRNQHDIVLQSMINTQRANKLAFLPADQIICEKTTDGGVTWVDAGITDTVKRAIFAEANNSVPLPQIDGKKNLLCGVRFTITGMKYNVPSGTLETDKYQYWNSNYVQLCERYCNLTGMYFWLSSSNDTIGVKVERATGANPNNWVTSFSNNDFYMDGWSGWDFITFNPAVIGGSVTQTGNYWNWRITFMTLGKNGSHSEMNTGYETQIQIISQIRGYGLSSWTAPNEYSKNDKIYTHDVNQNVTFPNKITANGGFAGSLTGNVTGDVSGKVNNHTVNSDVPFNAVFTDTTYSNATTSTAGLMSAADKTKLNGIAEGADALPDVTASDNGKVLRVVNGAWVAASIPVANGVDF